MKRTLAIALVALLSLALLTGCRSRQETTDTVPEDSGMDLLPDAADTIDPSSGANSDPTDAVPSEPNVSEPIASEPEASEIAPTEESLDPTVDSKSRILPRN